MTGQMAPTRDVGLQGHYAGFASRFASFIIDVFTATTLFALGGRVLEYVVTTLRGESFTLSSEASFSSVGFVAWAFLYCAYPLAVAGRTVGLAVVGLRVVRRDGGELGGWRAVVRVLTFPLSFLLFGLGFLLILVNREHRALHDLIAGTAVVYDWDARSARWRLLAKRRIA